MAGVISVRFTNAERKKLMELKQQRGCSNMSQAIRLMCGFPRIGEGEGYDGADDIDSVGTLIKLNVQLIERIDDNHKLQVRIARALHIETERTNTLSHLRADYVAPVVPVKEPETGPIVVEPRPYRNGDKHPALPEGFNR